LQVKLYAPRGSDPQSPHTRDELYVVARGAGWFVIGELHGERSGEPSEERRHRFGANDVLFAKAGTRHRFEDFSDDLAVWVMFYGPEGGERDYGPLTGLTRTGPSRTYVAAPCRPR